MVSVEFTRWRERQASPAELQPIPSIHDGMRHLAPQLACALMGLLSPSPHLFGQVPGSLGLLRVWAVLRGLKIGSTTGYVRELMDVLLPHAEKQGLLTV